MLQIICGRDVDSLCSLAILYNLNQEYILTNRHKVDKRKDVLFLDCHPSEEEAKELSSFGVVDHHPINYDIRSLNNFRETIGTIKSVIDSSAQSTAILLDPSQTNLVDLANRSDSFFLNNFSKWTEDQEVITLEYLANIDFESTLKRLNKDNSFLKLLDTKVFVNQFIKCAENASRTCYVENSIAVIQVNPWVSRICEYIKYKHNTRLVINLNNTSVNLRGQGAKLIAERFGGSGHSNSASFKRSSTENILTYLDTAKSILDRNFNV